MGSGDFSFGAKVTHDFYRGGALSSNRPLAEQLQLWIRGVHPLELSKLAENRPNDRDSSLHYRPFFYRIRVFFDNENKRNRWKEYLMIMFSVKFALR